MNKFILCINAETTGMNVAKDSIIQLRLELLSVDDATNIKSADAFDEYIIPERDFNITDGAFNAHHITKETVLSKGVHLRDHIEHIKSMFDTATHIMMWHGGNLILPMLLNALRTTRLDINIKNYSFIDTGEIELTLNSNKLTAVYERYTGFSLPESPTLSQKSRAIQDIFKGQLKKYGDAAVKSVIENTTNNILISPDNFLYIDSENEVRFVRGLHANEMVQDIIKSDLSYISWVMKDNFTAETKRTIAYIYNKTKNR